MGLTWIDFLMRLVPEGLVLILAGYAVAKKRVNMKLYLISSILEALVVWGFRALPISTVFPMIISSIIIVVLLVSINKIKTVHAILSTLISFVLLVCIESFTLLLLTKVFLIDTNEVFLSSGAVLRNLYGLPSLLLFGGIVLTYYLIATRKKKEI